MWKHQLCGGAPPHQQNNERFFFGVKCHVPFQDFALGLSSHAPTIPCGKKKSGNMGRWDRIYRKLLKCYTFLTFLSLDIKPNFDDTPDYWETDLENLFTSPKK